MTPVYSDDQPDKPNKQPGEEGTRYAVSREIFIRMRDEDAILIRNTDMQRYITAVRELEGQSNNWIAAAWALIGITASLAVAAATVPGQLLTFAVFALLCALGGLGCFIAHRQVNQQNQEAAEKIAREMEEAPVDHVEIRRLRPDDPLPPPASSA